MNFVDFLLVDFLFLDLTVILNLVELASIFLLPTYVALQVYVFPLEGALIFTLAIPFLTLALYVFPLILNLTVPDLTFLVP